MFHVEHLWIASTRPNEKPPVRPEPGVWCLTYEKGREIDRLGRRFPVRLELHFVPGFPGHFYPRLLKVRGRAFNPERVSVALA